MGNNLTNKVNKSVQAIYLDNHATTAIDQRVLDQMMTCLTTVYGNPASNHIFGIQANYLVEEARDKVANTLNTTKDSIIFLSGATEANNTVLKGVFETNRHQQPHFIVSAIEHKCILEASKHLEKLGAEVSVLKPDSYGLISPKQLKAALQPNTKLVSIMFANNEIGSINPVKELASICHQQAVLFHTDAAQAIGKLKIDVNDLDVDFMSASGHKFYGPKGSGFLYIKAGRAQELRPLLDGGGQEAGIRSGTLNVPAIVGLGQAMAILETELIQDMRHYRQLRDELFKILADNLSAIKLNGPALTSSNRLVNNLNVCFDNLNITELRRRLPLIAFSSSSACSSGDLKPSYVLQSIGLSSEQAKSSIRFGIGRFNTLEEVRLAANQLSQTILALTV